MIDKNNIPNTAFRLLRELIYRRTGIYYEDDKDYLLMDKLAPLIASHGLDSPLDYYFLIKQSQDMDAEWRKIQTRLAVNESYFWREADQITGAAKILIPDIRKERGEQPIRIWHAACATGEEPYSMAIALMEAGQYQYGPIEIIATDFNEEALKQARQGQYRSRSFRSIPQWVLQKYFTSSGKESYHLTGSVKEKVCFSYLNLMDTEEIQKLGSFDIIFCRNVFIYFSNEAIKQVIQSFYKALREPGYLFVASVESLLRITTLFDLVGIGDGFAYKKEIS